MKKTLLCVATSIAALPMLTHADSPYFSLQDGDGFKRFSVSVGALHVMPQGKAQPSELTHRLKKVKLQRVGDIKAQTVLDNVKPGSSVNPLLKATLDGLALINC